MDVSLSIKEVKELFMKYKDKIKNSEYMIHDNENNLTSGDSFDILINNCPFRFIFIIIIIKLRMKY